MLRRLGGEAGSPGTLATVPQPPLEVTLPRLLDAAEMAPATAALVARLNLLGERDQGRIAASMYRHLAHWPGFLALAWALLAPSDAAGQLGTAIAGNLATARDTAGSLVGRLDPAPPPEAAAGDARAAIARFAEHPIGKIVTICRMSRQSLPVQPA